MRLAEGRVILPNDNWLAHELLHGAHLLGCLADDVGDPGLSWGAEDGQGVIPARVGLFEKFPEVQDAYDAVTGSIGVFYQAVARMQQVVESALGEPS